MAHKWSHVIKAYADGYAIQFRNINFDDDWIDVVEEEGFDSSNFNIPNIEWRVKPTHELKYRVAGLNLVSKDKGYYYALILLMTKNIFLAMIFLEMIQTWFKWLRS